MRGRLRDFAQAEGLDESLFLTILRKLDFSRVQFEKDLAELSAGKKKKVLLAKSVDEMLLRHTEFISRVSIPAAEQFLAEFEEVVGQLKTAPAQFPWDTNPNLPEHTYRKALFAKWYKAVFSIDEDKQAVFLDAVVDGRSSGA